MVSENDFPHLLVYGPTGAGTEFQIYFHIIILVIILIIISSNQKHDLIFSVFDWLLIFYKSSVGKKTRINCILRELYGSGVEKMRLERHEFTTPSNKKVEIHSSASNYHIEICPG